MAKEELSLPVEMEKLEIDQVKLNKNGSKENPFVYVSQRKRNIYRSIVQNCPCSQKDKTLAVYKKKPKKLLKEPILNFVKHCAQSKHNMNKDKLSCSGNTSLDSIDNLCSLVDNCNQLKISTDANKPCYTQASDVKWWNVASTSSNRVSAPEKSHTGSSCCQQALNPPCDITIDELASYFETLVHIPKKMSSMAEMMYI